MHVIEFRELNERHQEYHRQMNMLRREFILRPDQAQRQEAEAQRQYVEWFMARGVMLIFPKGS